jgi:hypothetical protein
MYYQIVFSYRNFQIIAKLNTCKVEGNTKIVKFSIHGNKLVQIHYISLNRVNPNVLLIRISSTCRKHFPVLSSFMTCHRVCNYINTTGATSGARTAYPTCFVDRCLSFCTFSFGHCVVCSSIYGF